MHLTAHNQSHAHVSDSIMYRNIYLIYLLPVVRLSSTCSKSCELEMTHQQSTLSTNLALISAFRSIYVAFRRGSIHPCTRGWSP